MKLKDLMVMLEETGWLQFQVSILMYKGLMILALYIPLAHKSRMSITLEILSMMTRVRCKESMMT